MIKLVIDYRFTSPSLSSPLEMMVLASRRWGGMADTSRAPASRDSVKSMVYRGQRLKVAKGGVKG
jgi:hypothetical protein